MIYTKIRIILTKLMIFPKIMEKMTSKQIYFSNNNNNNNNNNIGGYLFIN